MNEIPHTHKFLSGGGEMGKRIREYDWDRSALGNPSTWPQALKTTLRLLLSSGHPMFIWWGPELIQFYNDGYQQSIGPERHPLALGQQGEACWQEIWPTIGPQIEQVMRGEGSVWKENHLVPITRNGRVEDVYWTYTFDPIYDETAPNEVGGVLVIVCETTQYVKLHQQLRLEEARWRDLFQRTPSFMCTLVGPDHIFEYANPRFLELVSNRDVLNRPVREALPEVIQQGFVDLLNKVYGSGESYTGKAVPISLAGDAHEGETLYLDFVYQPIRNADGQITGIFVNGSDVTDRILSERRLEQQDRRKDEFLAMLAHELRNPLAPIRNAAELMTRISDSDSAMHSLANIIQRQITQLTRLVDDLLEVSRISQGLLQLQREPMLLEKAVEFAIESTADVIPQKRLLLTFDCSESNLTVEGDFARLSQSFINLIVNAMKYTEEGGRIKIVLRRDDQHGVVDITDTGIGIEPSALNEIFELFMQVDKSIDRSRGGLGIGLSIVRTIINMHGGSIHAYSAGLGLGSTFSIRLPLISSLANDDKNPDQTPARSLKVLVVDDNEDSANSLAMLLEAVGHKTKVSYSGYEALGMVAAQTFDVILLDIGLPDFDGYKVAETIRANRTEQIIVAVSGYGQADDVRKALGVGFDGHLTKPVELEELQQTMFRLVNQRND